MEEDASGLTFQEWTPDVDTSRPPVTMLINSSDLRAAGFKLKEVIPPALEAAERGGLRTRGVGLRNLDRCHIVEKSATETSWCTSAIDLGLSLDNCLKRPRRIPNDDITSCAGVLEKLW